MTTATKAERPFPPRPSCSCHGFPACVHSGNGRPDPDARDEARDWDWHCCLRDCSGYSAVHIVLHEWVLADMAEAQRLNALALREKITQAREAGVTWQAIGDAIGIPKETAFRQHQAGSPIVVVKPFQTKRDNEESST